MKGYCVTNINSFSNTELRFFFFKVILFLKMFATHSVLVSHGNRKFEGKLLINLMYIIE